MYPWKGYDTETNDAFQHAITTIEPACRATFSSQKGPLQEMPAAVPNLPDPGTPEVPVLIRRSLLPARKASTPTGYMNQAGPVCMYG